MADVSAAPGWTSVAGEEQDSEMISRRTALVVSEFLESAFTKVGPNGRYFVAARHCKNLNDFLFEREYESYFLDLVRKLPASHVKPFMQLLHTGQSIGERTKEWSWDARMRRGNELLKALSAHVLGCTVFPNDDSKLTDLRNKLERSLEEDGYVFSDGVLRESESERNEVQAEQGELEVLFARLHLANAPLVSKHLKDSEDRYIDGQWGDCIKNARDYMEVSMLEVARAIAANGGANLPQDIKKSGFKLRKYLLDEKILTIEQEKVFIEAVYSLLSETGGHANMSEKDQARIFRRLALLAAQFVLLRYERRLAEQSEASLT